MEDLFLKLIQLSLLGSMFALAVIAVRLIFPKMPKWILCLLWGLVALRLICPFSIESSFSLVPEKVSSGQLLSNIGSLYIEDTDIIYENSNQYRQAVDAGLTPIHSEIGNYVIAAKGSYTAPATLGDTLLPILCPVWLAGMIAMLLYTVISFYLLRRKMAEATRYRDNIWQCQPVDSPFVLGFFRPRIYLPYGLSDADRENVLAHELAHIRRRDHWWKPLGFLLLSIHWFNPVLWLAYILLCRDIESACDEKVIRSMNKQQKQAYSTTLLHCSVHRRRIAACPLAFGETGVKERIVGIMKYKKPAFWIIISALVISVIAGVCFLTAPKTERQPGENDEKLLEMAQQVANWAPLWADTPLAQLNEENDTYRSILGYGSEAVDFYVDYLKKNGDPQYSVLNSEGKTQTVMALACARITGIGADGYGTKWVSGQQWLKLYKSAKKSDYRPDLTLTNLCLDWQRKDLRCFGPNADIQQVWQAEYQENEVLEQSITGLYSLLLSPSSDLTVSGYKIYKTDGTLYDDGYRSFYSSLSPMVMKFDEGWQVLLPYQTGEYIYVLEVYWDAYDITLTYGLKVVATGETTGSELAYKKVIDYFGRQGTDLHIDYKTTVCFGAETVRSYYYIFSVNGLADGDLQVAVDVDGNTMYPMEGDTILFEKILE